MKTIRETLLQHDVNSKLQPSQAIKPAIKDAFFVKEQRMVNPDTFVEPDDEQLKNTETGKHLEDYLEEY